jgi:hypothetical protein
MIKKPTKKQTISDAVNKLQLKKSKRSEMLDVIQILYPGFDPVMLMIEEAERAKKDGNWDLRVNILKELAQYIYAKKRSVEVKGDDSADPVRVSIVNYGDAKKTPEKIESEEK